MRVIALARSQKLKLMLVEQIHLNEKFGCYQGRQIIDKRRESARAYDSAVEQAAAMEAAAVLRPCDVECSDNAVLAAAVRRLVAYRLAHVKYAGRWLP